MHRQEAADHRDVDSNGLRLHMKSPQHCGTVADGTTHSKGATDSLHGMDR